MKIKFYLIVVIFAIFIWIINIPLWFHLTGADTKYWVAYRSFDNYGLSYIGSLEKVEYNFQVSGGNFKNYKMGCDTAIFIKGETFTTFGRTMNSINGSWHPRKVIYHSNDTIKFIGTCYPEDRYIKTDSGMVYNIKNTEPPVFVLDTIYYINIKPPKVILNQWELPKDEDELDISL